MMDIVAGAFATLAVVVIQVLGAVIVGQAALLLVGPRFIRPPDRFLLGLTLGIGIQSTLILALSAVGLLDIVSLLMVSGALPAALLLLQVDSLQPGRGLDRALGRYRGSAGFGVVAGVICLFLFLALLRSQAPESNWDSLTYHLRVPELFLEEGKIFLPPDNLHVAHVGLFHMHYLLPLALGLEGGPVLWNSFVFLGLALAVAQALSVRGSSPGLGILATAILFGNTLLVLVAVTPMVDTTVAFFGFLATDHLLRQTVRPSFRGAVLVGALVGIAAGVKLQSAVLVAVAAAASFILLLAQKQEWKIPALTGIVALGVAAPWLIKNLVLLGDPLYPLLFGSQIDPWLRNLPLVGDGDSSGRRAITLAREPFTFWRFLTDPGSLSPDLEARLSVVSPALLFGLIGLLARRSILKALPWLAIGSIYCVLLLMRSSYINVRYLIPIFPLAVVGAAIGLDWLWQGEREANPRWMLIRRATIFGAVIPILLVLYVVPSMSISFLGEVGPGQRYFSEAMEGPELVERHVPAGDTVLLIYEARGAAFDGAIRQDNLSNTWPTLHFSGYGDACLAGTGLKYVLIHWPRVRGLAGRVGQLPGITDGALERFSERCLAPLDSAGGKILYRLKTESHPQARAER